MSTFYKTITIVEMKAFDREMQEHFVDSTSEQCTNYIFKNICETAVIKSVTEYIIEQAIIIKDFQRKKE